MSQVEHPTRWGYRQNIEKTKKKQERIYLFAGGLRPRIPRPWKSGDLEIWGFGDLGTWTSRNLGLPPPKKTKTHKLSNSKSILPKMSARSGLVRTKIVQAPSAAISGRKKKSNKKSKNQILYILPKMSARSGLVGKKSSRPHLRPFQAHFSIGQKNTQK